jgi:carbon-monoxide dehydrogenase small subunit
MKHPVTLQVNGFRHDLEVAPAESLNAVLRDRLGLTGTKRGCDTGGCGACTVLVDGRAVYSCMLLAVQATGKQVTTIEGLARAEGLHPVQQAFVECGALQCGFCTPGFIMASVALLNSNPRPAEAEVREALVGNLCRCTGYTKIFEAVFAAARRLRAGDGKGLRLVRAELASSRTGLRSE